MLKVRVIPTLLWKDYGLVKGERFNSWRRVGSVLPAIKVYNLRDVDELILVDITASRDCNEPDYDSIVEFTEECSVPMTVGGGIVNIEQIRKLLMCGADKVSISTASYLKPDLIDEASAQFGTQCIVASIDVKEIEKGDYRCFSHAGTRDTGKEPISWAKEMQERGAGELLLTSIDRDGTMIGYDIDLIGRVCEAVDIPVIASGGAGNYEHMISAIKEASASAIAAASIFHFTEQTPKGAKEALSNSGISVRKAFGDD